ncbi:MAG TPA: outer membrane beta-barrel protein [Bacteroidales bacterium]|nr:outer membrane beta-barrel protein [Bacteroidales bacterium]
MKIFSKFLPFIIFFLFSSSAIAQEVYKQGFIVTNNGIKQEGLIDNMGIYKNTIFCRFKSSTVSEPVIYKPGEIHSYGFDAGGLYISKYYKNFPGDDHTLFLECIVKGKLSLYHRLGIYVHNQSESEFRDYFYLGNDSLGLITLAYKHEYRGNQLIEHEVYKAQLRALLSNDPVAYAMIDNTSYNRNDLYNIIVTYNKDTAPDQLTYTLRKKPKEKLAEKVFIKAGLSGGSNMTFMHFSLPVDARFFQHSSLTSFKSFSLGLVFDIWLRQRMARNFTFKTGALLHYMQFNPEYSLYNMNYTGNAEFVMLDIPVMFNYTYLKSKLQPFLSVGLNYGLNINSGLKEINKSLYSNFNPFEYVIVNEKQYPNTGIKGIISTGIKYPFNKKHAISLELRYIRYSSVYDVYYDVNYHPADGDPFLVNRDIITGNMQAVSGIFTFWF